MRAIIDVHWFVISMVSFWNCVRQLLVPKRHWRVNLNFITTNSKYQMSLNFEDKFTTSCFACSKVDWNYVKTYVCMFEKCVLGSNKTIQVSYLQACRNFAWAVEGNRECARSRLNDTWRWVDTEADRCLWRSCRGPTSCSILWPTSSSSQSRSWILSQSTTIVVFLQACLRNVLSRM